MGRNSVKRKSSVAGYFYPGGRDSLKKILGSITSPGEEKADAIGVVSPHAGFQYSGRVAGAVFSSVRIPKNIILIGPSHRYGSSGYVLMKKGEWETPLGDVPVNTVLADSLMERFPRFIDDKDIHKAEHSLEVQLPFIQYLASDVTIVPICIAIHASYNLLQNMGEAVASAVDEYPESVLLVASTDMSHYVPEEEARKKDFMAIEKILRLDARGLYETVIAEDISMCGFQPTVAAIAASKELGASHAELIKYQTSGDVSGDYNEVVGYAGLRIL